MSHRGLLQLVALVLLLLVGPVPVAAGIADFARLRLDCGVDRAAARIAARAIPYFVGCRYDTVREALPPFTTVDWEPSDKAPLGIITAQSAPPQLSVERLRREFTITVSTGPAITVDDEVAIEGEALAFRMSGQPRPPPNSSFEVQYRLSTDSAGEAAAVAGRDYAGIVDRDFASGGVLEVRTLEGGGTERLHLFVTLQFPPDGARSGAVLAHAQGTIVARPRVTLFDAMAREGEELRFLAMIDRNPAVRGALTYQVAIEPGTAVAGRDFQPPEAMTLTFEPGETAKYFPVPTLDNAETAEDRQLQLMAGIAGQPMARARGTILNATPGSAPVATPTGDRPTDADPLLGIGLDWLGAIGAAAIGVLAGFGFGARKPKPVVPAAETEPEAPATPALVPVVGWTTETPDPPRVTGGNLAPDGPPIAIDVATEAGTVVPPDSLVIIPESSSDA